MKNNPQDSSPALQEQWQRFGALLRERRNAAKLSRVKLARHAKVCDTTIKFTETARHRPSRATLVCLLSVADLRLTWADVPGGLREPFAKKKEIPAAPLPSSTPAPVENKEIPATQLPIAAGTRRKQREPRCAAPIAAAGIRRKQREPRGAAPIAAGTLGDKPRSRSVFDGSDRLRRDQFADECS